MAARSRIILCLIFVYLSAPAIAGEWIGPAFATDGDTIYVGGVRLRLLGIDAPEIAQSCVDGERREYACGDAARSFLENLIRDQRVTCRGTQTDRWKRPLVRCAVAGQDLGQALVQAGWAVAYVSPDYLSAEDEARRRRIGMWAGQFVPPSEWRRGRR